MLCTYKTSTLAIFGFVKKNFCQIWAKIVLANGLWQAICEVSNHPSCVNAWGVIWNFTKSSDVCRLWLPSVYYPGIIFAFNEWINNSIPWYPVECNYLFMPLDNWHHIQSTPSRRHEPGPQRSVQILSNQYGTLKVIHCWEFEGSKQNYGTSMKIFAVDLLKCCRYSRPKWVNSLAPGRSGSDF